MGNIRKVRHRAVRSRGGEASGGIDPQARAALVSMTRNAAERVAAETRIVSARLERNERIMRGEDVTTAASS